jgi:hypothetical protein
MSLYTTAYRFFNNQVKLMSEKFKKYCLDCFTEPFVREKNQPTKNLLNGYLSRFGISNTNLAISILLLLILLGIMIILVYKFKVSRNKHKKKSSNRCYIYNKIEQDIEQFLDRLNNVKLDSHLVYELCYLVERVLKKTNRYTKELNNQKQKFINTRIKKKVLSDSNTPNTITSSAIESIKSNKPKTRQKLGKHLNSTPISSDVLESKINSHSTSYDTNLLFKDEDLVSLESNVSSSSNDTTEDLSKTHDSINTIIFNSKNKKDENSDLRSQLNDKNFDTIIERATVSGSPSLNQQHLSSTANNKSLRYYIPKRSSFAGSNNSSIIRKPISSYKISLKKKQIRIKKKINDNNDSFDHNNSFEIEFRDELITEPISLKSSLKKTNYDKQKNEECENKNNDDNNKDNEIESSDLDNDNTGNDKIDINLDTQEEELGETEL